MRAYPLDLRERVVQAADQGYEQTEIIKLFGVSSHHQAVFEAVT